MQGSQIIIVLLLCATVALASRLVQPKKSLMRQLNSYKTKGNRVIGGQDAEPGSAPYQISLQNRNGYHMCGGSIVNEEWILTAAHCVDRYRTVDMRIVTGTNEWEKPGAVYFVDEYYVHSSYNDPDYANDIALIHLNDTIEFNEFTKAAPLVSEPLHDGDDLILTGWGSTELWGDTPDNLQVLTLKYMSHEECVEALKKADMDDMKDAGHICTFTKRGEGSCHGDSGGPLVNVKGELCGLVNWGMPCAADLPDAHANVYFYLDWIQRIIDGKSELCVVGSSYVN